MASIAEAAMVDPVPNSIHARQYYNNSNKKGEKTRWCRKKRKEKGRVKANAERHASKGEKILKKLKEGRIDTNKIITHKHDALINRVCCKTRTMSQLGRVLRLL